MAGLGPRQIYSFQANSEREALCLDKDANWLWEPKSKAKSSPGVSHWATFCFGP